MKKLITCLIVLAAMLPAQSAGGVGPRIECSNETWNFGSVPQQQELKHVFKVKNAGDRVLEIRQVVPSCQCAAAMPKKNKLGPGEETAIDVTLKILSFKGRLEKIVTVISNDRARPQLRLNISGEVLPPYYVKPSNISFGKFSKSDPSKEIAFKIVTTPGTQMNIKKVVSSSDLLTVRATGESEKRADGSVSHSYVARIKAGATVGLMRENVTILTDFKSLEKTIIPVTADVAGEVLLSLQNLNFGACKKGQTKTKTLVVTKSGKPDLEISGVDVLPKGQFDTAVEVMEEGRKFKVSVTLKKDAKSGYVKGTVNIKTNCPGENNVRAWFHAFISRK